MSSFILGASQMEAYTAPLASVSGSSVSVMLSGSPTWCLQLVPAHARMIVHFWGLALVVVANANLNLSVEVFEHVYSVFLGR